MLNFYRFECGDYKFIGFDKDGRKRAKMMKKMERKGMKIEDFLGLKLLFFADNTCQISIL